MYFEAGKVWGLGIVGDCGKGLVSSFSEAFDAAEGFLASELQNIQYSYFVFFGVQLVGE